MKAEELFERALPKITANLVLADGNGPLVLYYMYSNGYGCDKDKMKADMFLSLAIDNKSLEATLISLELDPLFLET